MATVNDFLAADVTLRRVWYWTRRGYLRPVNPNCGSGDTMHWPNTELFVAQTMRRLADAGIVPAVAEQIARAARAGTPTVEIADGITITVLPVDALVGAS